MTGMMACLIPMTYKLILATEGFDADCELTRHMHWRPHADLHATEAALDRILMKGIQFIICKVQPFGHRHLHPDGRTRPNDAHS